MFILVACNHFVINVIYMWPTCRFNILDDKNTYSTAVRKVALKQWGITVCLTTSIIILKDKRQILFYWFYLCIRGKQKRKKETQRSDTHTHTHTHTHTKSRRERQRQTDRERQRETETETETETEREKGGIGLGHLTPLAMILVKLLVSSYLFWIWVDVASSSTYCFWMCSFPEIIKLNTVPYCLAVPNLIQKKRNTEQ